MLLEKWKNSHSLTIAEIKFSLGNVLHRKGDNDRALEYLSVAAEIGGDTFFSYKAKALIR